MTSSVLKSRKRTTSFTAVGAVAIISAGLSAGLSRAQAAEETAATAIVAEAPAAIMAPGPNPFADRFPNVVLKTHEGKNVRFYDDLLKGKIVLINFFYVTCEER